MNKKLILIGGALNIFLFIFHAMFWKIYEWPENLLCLHYDDQARMQILLIQSMAVYALFAYLSLFHSKAILSTLLGRRIAWIIVFFYFIRTINQLVFWDALWIKSIVIITAHLFFILVYLVPLISTRDINTGTR